MTVYVWYYSALGLGITLVAVTLAWCVWALRPLPGVMVAGGFALVVWLADLHVGIAFALVGAYAVLLAIPVALAWVVVALAWRIPRVRRWDERERELAARALADRQARVRELADELPDEWTRWRRRGATRGSTNYRKGPHR